MRRTALLLIAIVAGCGTRTAPATFDGADAALDAVVDGDVEPDGVVDVEPDTVVDAIVVADATGCPAHRPLLGASCDGALEGRSCAFGIDCEVECVCERGSWICANDTCAGRCPDRVPEGRACPAGEVDRECTYPRGCPTTCRCDGERWNCSSPPC